MRSASGIPRRVDAGGRSPLGPAWEGHVQDVGDSGPHTDARTVARRDAGGDAASALMADGDALLAFAPPLHASAPVVTSPPRLRLSMVKRKLRTLSVSPFFQPPNLQDSMNALSSPGARIAARSATSMSAVRRSMPAASRWASARPSRST